MNAVISNCGLYRYRLEREAGLFAAGTTAVIMVNPSTADATEDDATIRKVRGFGQRNGWGRIIVGNLFAYRATDVSVLAKVADPIGPDNDKFLALLAEEADRVVFAWGPLAKQPRDLRGRWRDVAAIFAAFQHKPLAIGEPVQDGHPRHPLMPPYTSAIKPWQQPL
jgi:hypothetical protein